MTQFQPKHISIISQRSRYARFKCFAAKLSVMECSFSRAHIMEDAKYITNHNIYHACSMKLSGTLITNKCTEYIL